MDSWRRRHPRRVRRLLRGILAGAALGGLPVLLALAFFASRFTGLTAPSALEQAQTARQIARGAGLATDVLTPLDLARGPKPGAEAQPTRRHCDFRHPPLYPLLLASVVGTEGAPDNLIGLLSLGFWLATAAMSCAFAWRLFGGRTAAVATVLVVVNLTLLREAITGRETMAWTLVVLVWLYLTHETAQLPAARAWWWPVLSGCLFGASCLVSYLSLALLVPAAILVVMLAPAPRWRSGLGFLAGVLAATSPWLIRNLVAAGDPLFSLSWWTVATGTSSHPGDTVLQWYAPTGPGPLAYVVGHAGEMVGKFALGLSQLREGLFASADAYVAAIFLVSLLVRPGEESVAKLRNGLCLLLLAAVPTALGSASPRVFHPLVPLVTIFASRFLLERLDQLHLGFRVSSQRRIRSATMRTVVLYLCLGIAALPLLVAFATSPYQYYDPAHPAPFETLKARIPEDATVLTNFPWQVAWYTDRRAVLLPRTTGEVAPLEQHLGRVDYLLLSPPLHPQLVADDRQWTELATRIGQALGGFAAGERITIAPGLSVVLRPRAATGSASSASASTAGAGTPSPDGGRS